MAYAANCFQGFGLTLTGIDCAEAKFQPSLFNQKHKVGWFLLMFVDEFRV